MTMGSSAESYLGIWDEVENWKHRYEKFIVMHVFLPPPTGSATQVTIKLVRTPTSNKGARVVKVISASQVKQEVSNSQPLVPL